MKPVFEYAASTVHLLLEACARSMVIRPDRIPLQHMISTAYTVHGGHGQVDACTNEHS